MRGLMVMAALLLAWLVTSGFSKYEKRGLAFSGEFSASQVKLLVDEAWMDTNGVRHVRQEIFDSVFSMIKDAEQFILIDFFLLNDFLYQEGAGLRQLSQEITDQLVAKRKARPDVEIIFITDPLNTVYGSLESPHFKAMQDAGIHVVWTNLDQLRDSNPVFSKPWRLLGKPWGTGPGHALGNPMGEGRVSVRSMLKLMNFKANHRKVVITDKSLLVTSANPHSGSSGHWNTALRVEGAGLQMALQAESTILQFSGAAHLRLPTVKEAPVENGQKLVLLTERKIKEYALALLEAAKPGMRIELVMFYFSDRDLIKAFIDAKKRGCDVRIMLDANKDAFGRTKNGIPNRQTAAKLVKAGIPVRWANTNGEQCHVKMLYVEHADRTATLLQGSSNFTRRNMDNFNAECDLALTASANDPNMIRARRVFERWWTNPDGRIYSTDYETYKDGAAHRRVQAWLMEKSGLSTF